MHLVLWVLAILVVPSLCLSLSYEMTNFVLKEDCDSGTYSHSSWYCDFYSFPSAGAARKYFEMMEALAAFAVLLLISHFTLFVMACVETDRRRKYEKTTQVVYLVAAPGPNDGRVYYTPMTAQQLGGNGNRGSSVLAPLPVHHQQQQQQQQENADPGAHGYYAPPAAVQPGTAA